MISGPLVSIGIPTFERPKGLKKCLDAIRNQTYKNLEIIISDNCSTNLKVDEYCLDLINIDPRVIYYKQEVNIGPEANFNYVFNKSTGSMFMWIADDDWIDHEYIEQCVEFLMANSDYHHVAGKTQYLKHGNQYRSLSFPEIKSNYAILRVYHYFGHVWKNGIFYGLFWKRQDIPIHLSPIPGADWAFMARQCLRGKIKVLNHVNYFREIGGISSNRNSIIKRWNLNYWKKFFFEFYCIYIICRDTFRNTKTNFLIALIYSIPIIIILHFKVINIFLRKRFDKNYF